MSPRVAPVCFLAASLLGAGCSPARPPEPPGPPEASSPAPAAQAPSAPPPSAEAPAGAAGPVEVSLSLPEGQRLGDRESAPLASAIERAVRPLRAGPLARPGWALLDLTFASSGEVASVSLVDGSLDEAGRRRLASALTAVKLPEDAPFGVLSSRRLLAHVRLR